MNTIHKTGAVVAAVVLMLADTAHAVTPEIDESGNYTFTVPSGSETYAGVISGSGITVTKKGTGILELIGENTFTGVVNIEAGTLKAAPAALTGKPNVNITSGARLDVSGNGGTAWTTWLGDVTASGHGPDGQGAIWRLSGNVTDMKLMNSLTLAADTTISNNYQFFIHSSTYNGNGHVLTKAGSGDWYVQGTGGTMAPGAGGRIRLSSGSWTVQSGPTFSGDESTTLELGGASFISRGYNRWRTLPWTLDVTKASTISVVAAVISDDQPYENRLAGPVTMTAGLTVSPDSGYFVNFENTITSTDAHLTVDGPGTVVFKKPVSLNATGGWKSSFSAKKGLSRFTGEEGHYFGGNIYAGTYAAGSIEFADAGHVTLSSANGNQTWVSGTRESPVRLSITNTVFASADRATFVGNEGGYAGCMEIESDSVVTNTFYVGGLDNAHGRVRQRGGSVVNTYALRIGVGGSRSQGFYDLSGGSLLVRNSICSIGWSGFGTFLQRGGEVNGSFRLGQNGGGGVFHQTGGYAQVWHQFGEGTSSTGAGSSGLYAFEGASTTNVAKEWVGFQPANAYTGIIAVNDGAHFKAAKVYRESSATAAGSLSYFGLSVNGGVRSPGGANSWSGEWCANGATPNDVLVHEDGVIVEPESSGAYSFKFPLAAPTGKVVASIALPASGGFLSDNKYMGPARVVIGGVGRGAAAVAEFDEATRTITGIRVVAPGTGYDDSTTATITSSDGSTTYSCAVTVADAPTTGAGLTLRGNGTLTLKAANTYRGPTSVEGGSLVFEHADGLPSGSAVKVSAGALLNLNGIARTIPRLEGDGMVTGSLTVTEGLSFAMHSNATMQVSGSVTLADGVVLALSGSTDDLDAQRKNVLLSAAGGIVREGAFSVPDLPRPWQVLVSDTSIAVAYPRGTVIVFR